MKRTITYLLCFVCVCALYSCTSFKDELADLGGVKIDPEKLSLSPESHVCNLTVRSGEKWTLSSSPDWMKIKSIDGSRNMWGVSLSVNVNNGYNRSGQLTLQSKSSTAVLTVEQEGWKGKFVALTAVSLSETSMEITEGESKQLKAVFTPTDASNQNVSWKSSNTSVATVSSTGQVTAVKEGTATITVTTEEGNKTATCKVTVKKKVISVTNVSLNKTAMTLTEGETSQLSATIDPSNATNSKVTWKSGNTSVATVSSNGLVTAVKEGTATITVTTEDGGKTATCTVTVKKKEVPVTGVSLNKSEVSLTEGETLQLTATVSPSNATNKNVSWKSSNTSVATVSSSGLITAISEGSATITVTTVNSSKTATCKVTVKKKVISVTGVSLDKTETTLTEGETCQLTATVSPSNASNKNVSWQSGSTSIATVSSSGLVTAVKEGTATITVTTEDGKKTATCKVTVRKKVVAVTGVALDKSSLTLTEGETYQLAATVSPSDASNKNVSWKSNSTSIATVSSTGLVSAVKEGSATITVTTEDGNKTATCKVTVKKKTVSVTGVSLNYTGLTMQEGETWQLTATVSPSNASNKNIRWSSNTTQIATVTQDGLVKGVSEGTATITVTTEDGNKTATCRVTVMRVPVTGVTLDKKEIILTVGSTSQLTATVKPDNATNKTVKWTSNATSVADVSSSGLVKAKQAGTAVITVSTTDGGYSDQCTVTVAAGQDNGHYYVDLGLSIMWATCNVGASSPEAFGNYYAWGETSTKSDYDWSTYKWCKGSYNTLTKYNNNISYGSVDNRSLLELSDDAARANWGGKWRMPTEAEWTELLNNCTSTWTTQNGVYGRKFTSTKNGSSIFLPAAGYRSGGSLYATGSWGEYWSASIRADYSYDAQFLYFSSDEVYRNNTNHFVGISVRPVNGDQVRVSGLSLNFTQLSLKVSESTQLTATVVPDNAAEKGVTWSSDNPSVASVDSKGLVTAKQGGTATITATTIDGGYYKQCVVAINGGYENGYEWVDLGLSVKWATCNVGASTPEAYGNYYAWGETTTKSDYSWSTYRWCNGSYNSLTKYNNNSSYGFVDNRLLLELSDDAARANWGGRWRMPTDADWAELLNNCTSTWTMQNGVYGRKFTSTKNGNSIFLPAAGARLEGNLKDVGSGGDYWSSSLYTDKPSCAWGMFFFSDRVGRSGNGTHNCGQSVRPVIE